MTAKNKTLTEEVEIEIKMRVPAYAAPLYLKGWTLSGAAKVCGCSPTHLRWVLLGERKPSSTLTEKLNALPKQQLRPLGC